MTNLTLIPIEDTFESELSQEFGNAATDLIFYTEDAPTGTIPSGYKVAVTINPGKSTEETVLVSTLSSSTFTIASSADRAQNLGNAYTNTRQTHPRGSKVIISNPYVLWKNVDDAITSKADTDSPEFTTYVKVPVYADDTARDAGIPSPENGMEIYNTAEGAFQDYVAGSWVNRVTGATPNASTTTAGKVEIATDSEVDAGAETGGTGAKLVATPDQIAEVIQEQKHTYIATDSGTATTIVGSVTPAISAYADGMRFVVKLGNTLTGPTTANFNSVGAKDIKKRNDVDVESGDYEAGQYVELVYRSGSDDFQIMTPTASDPGVDSVSFVAAEAITANQSVALLPYEVEWFSQLTEVDIDLGDANARRRYGIKITPKQNVATMPELNFRLKKASSGQDVTIRIETDNSGEPSGTLVDANATSTISASAIATSYSTEITSWAGSFALTAGTTYWIVLQVASTDGTNYISIGVNSSYDENYITFTRLTYDQDTASWGSSVTNATPFFWTDTTLKALGMGLVPTDADFGGRTWAFIGFATSAASAEASTGVQTDIVTGLSGLTPGKDYWLSTTPGQITTTKPNGLYGNDFAYKVFRSHSTTSGKINLGPRRVMISQANLTATTATDYILWFSVSLVRAFASAFGITWSSMSIGFYDGSNNNAVNVANSSAGTVSSADLDTGSAVFVDDPNGGPDEFDGVISNKTDIGFTFTMTEQGTASAPYILECTD